MGDGQQHRTDNHRRPRGRAHPTPRSLNRHLHQRIGTNPLSWLLEQTDHGIDLIAQQSGFATAATLRRHFRQALDTTPDSYRRTFSHHTVGTSAPEPA
jgi:transcriptional regulator GlxA family with amidase domain